MSIVTSTSKRKQCVWQLICHFGSFRNSVWLLLVKTIWQPWLPLQLGFARFQDISFS